MSSTNNLIKGFAGIWLYHCHISDHMLADIFSHYQVNPQSRHRRLV